MLVFIKNKLGCWGVQIRSSVIQSSLYVRARDNNAPSTPSGCGALGPGRARAVLKGMFGLLMVAPAHIKLTHCGCDLGHRRESSESSWKTGNEKGGPARSERRSWRGRRWDRFVFGSCVDFFFFSVSDCLYSESKLDYWKMTAECRPKGLRSS